MPAKRPKRYSMLRSAPSKAVRGLRRSGRLDDDSDSDSDERGGTHSSSRRLVRPCRRRGGRSGRLRGLTAGRGSCRSGGVSARLDRVAETRDGDDARFLELLERLKVLVRLAGGCDAGGESGRSGGEESGSAHVPAAREREQRRREKGNEGEQAVPRDASKGTRPQLRPRCPRSTESTARRRWLEPAPNLLSVRRGPSRLGVRPPHAIRSDNLAHVER